MTTIKKPAAKSKVYTDFVIDKPSVSLKGPFSEQSYIVHKKPPQCVVHCSRSLNKDHYKVLKTVLTYIQKTPGCTKVMAVAKRNAILGR